MNIQNPIALRQKQPTVPLETIGTALHGRTLLIHVGLSSGQFGHLRHVSQPVITGKS
ncbi:MAG: hypothetical protein IPK73_00730 [Candidatus Obscuribacter sp.]|nr:hypothetical protein [Candidatus Obscuribacter sp.]MBK9280478.1 hypothetical protein [Candidatus Obscuribacter sp.]MBL8085667.1 hypothetical protein [Candidatus Obscuribacter sp.]HMW88634.1 hypothetical protein [Candidatus Obscuribacter sp.]HMY53823.1 hypothetical protein [Candidatus Obscuribacter sp.]